VTPQGDALIVVVEAHAQRLVRVPIEARGSAGAPVVVAELHDTAPDGVALAADRSLWVTLYRPDGLMRVPPDGVAQLVVDDHRATMFDAPTNIAWVGEGLDRAVVTNVGDTFLSIGDVGVGGRVLHAPSSPEDAAIASIVMSTRPGGSGRCYGSGSAQRSD
jgi:sugar lactone lactonase YvrE